MIAENEEETWKLDAKLEQLKRQEQTLNERMQRLKAQGELKEQAARAALKSAEEALEAEKARAGSNKMKNEEEEREIQMIKKNMAKIREDHVREMEGLAKKFTELRQTVRKYHGVLFEAMSKVDEEIHNIDQNQAETPMSEMDSPSPGTSPLSITLNARYYLLSLLLYLFVLKFLFKTLSLALGQLSQLDANLFRSLINLCKH